MMMMMPPRALRALPGSGLQGASRQQPLLRHAVRGRHLGSEETGQRSDDEQEGEQAFHGPRYLAGFAGAANQSLAPRGF